MIDAMLELAKGRPAFVFLSSAKDSLLPSAMKRDLLEQMLTRNGSFPPNLTLVDTAVCAVPCGGPLGGWGYLKDKGMVGPEVTLVVGSDQGPKFDPATAPMWKTIDPAERPSIVSIPRAGSGAATFSSTKARQALAESGILGLTPFLKDATSALTEAGIQRVGAELLKKKAKWKGGAADDSVFDEDLDGGRRRKTRRRRRRRLTRNKASGKA